MNRTILYERVINKKIKWYKRLFNIITLREYKNYTYIVKS